MIGRDVSAASCATCRPPSSVTSAARPRPPALDAAATGSTGRRRWSAPCRCIRPFSFQTSQTDVSLVLSRAARDSGGTSRPLSSSCSRFLRVTTHPMQTRVAAVALLCVCTGAHAAGIANPEDYVNTLGGSDSKYDLSHGNIMPDLTMPWGFNAWAPQSNDGQHQSDGEGWWFYSQDRRFFGIRCTHQPSPWIGDYGQLRFAGGLVDPGHQDEWLFSAYEPKDSAWYPYYQNFTLLQFGARTGYTTVETAPTEHGVVINWNFPKHATGKLADGWNQTRRVWVSLNGKSGQVNGASTDSSGLATMTGYTTDVGNGRGMQFKHHYRATVAGGADGTKAVKPYSTGVVDGKWAWMDFDPTDPDTQTLVMRVATSLISPEQAQLNHKREVEQIGLGDAKAAAKAVWNKLLSKISVDDMGPGYTPQQESDWLTGFYSSLYRAAKFPRKLFEQDANGNNIHYSPNTGKVLPGVLSADQGFWDAYRTTYSLLSIWDPCVTQNVTGAS